MFSDVFKIMFNDFSLHLLGLSFLENVYSMQTEEAGANMQAHKLNLQERVLVVGKFGEFFDGSVAVSEMSSSKPQLCGYVS